MVKECGFDIFRSTYTSDKLGMTYLERIRGRIIDRLNSESESDWRDRLEIPIIESALLDGVMWEQARNIFDAWCLEDLKSQPNYNEA